MLFRYILPFIIGALLTGCKTSNSLETVTNISEAELEKVVYHQAISALYPDCTEFLLFDSTTNALLRSEELNNLSDIGDETITNFFAQNEKRHFVDESLQLHGEVVFTRWMTLRNNYKSNDPQDNLGLDFVKLRSDYPNMCGILEFSKVGFNNTFDEALVSVVFHEKYGACYETGLVLLGKGSDDVWSIQDRKQVEVCN